MNYHGRSVRLSILTQLDRLKALAQKLGNALLPGSCLLCRADSHDHLLCAACLADLPAVPEHRCPRCADRTPLGEQCGACLKELPHFDRTVAAFRYDFPVDRIIHALKYGHQLAVATWCGQQLAKCLTAHEADLVIPLPLHADRMRQRGFNQSAEIARVLGNCLNLPVDRSNVVRTRATPPQAELPYKARHKNVRGAFECHADFSGRRLLLIDDVMTTGASTNECARILKLHGAESVTVGVIARAFRQ